MTRGDSRPGAWWCGLPVCRERRLKELLLNRRDLRGPLVGLAVAGEGGAADAAVFVSGAVAGPSPWRVGQGVAVHALQERPCDPQTGTVRCAAEVILVRDLGDGRAQVIARVHDAERTAMERQNWPAPADRTRPRPLR